MHTSYVGLPTSIVRGLYKTRGIKMEQKIDKRQIIINKNRREDYKKEICGDVYHLDRYELRKYREFDIENKPWLEEMYIVWLENYT